jgi:hypothetical protein
MSFEPANTFAALYEAKGTSSDGASYLGFAAIHPHGLFGHVSSIIGKTERHGLAVLTDQRLLIAWGPKDKVEIGTYEVRGDSMHGIWIPPAAKGDDLGVCGDEKSIRIAENEWRIEQAHDLEKNPYTGTISIQPISEGKVRIVEILWRLHDGEYRSFGLEGDGWMVSTFNFAPEFPHAIAAYKRIPGGFKGVQIWKDDRAVSHEVLMCPTTDAASGSLGERGAA